MRSFRDDVVMVTGASGLIGSACVAAFLGEGARVAAVDIEDRMAAGGALSGIPPETFESEQLVFIETDLTVGSDIEQAFATTEERFGPVTGAREQRRRLRAQSLPRAGCRLPRARLRRERLRPAPVRPTRCGIHDRPRHRGTDRQRHLHVLAAVGSLLGRLRLLEGSRRRGDKGDGGGSRPARHPGERRWAPAR